MISIGYNNMSESKVVIKDIPSVMEAYRQMDELIKSGRVMIEYGPDGEPSAIRACIILNTKSGRHVYCAKPENYTRVTTEVRALYCDVHNYTVLIKTGRRVFERTTNDSTHAATLYVHGMRAGYPVFLKRDGIIVAADNCGPRWDKYSIHEEVRAKAEKAEELRRFESMFPRMDMYHVMYADYPCSNDWKNDELNWTEAVMATPEEFGKFAYGLSQNGIPFFVFNPNNAVFVSYTNYGGISCQNVRGEYFVKALREIGAKYPSLYEKTQSRLSPVLRDAYIELKETGCFNFEPTHKGFEISKEGDVFTLTSFIKDEAYPHPQFGDKWAEVYRFTKQQMIDAGGFENLQVAEEYEI